MWLFKILIAIPCLNSLCTLSSCSVIQKQMSNNLISEIMKAFYFVQPVENKKKRFFGFLKKDNVRTVLISQFGFSYYAFDEDAKLLKRKFRFEKSFEFDNFSICIPQERFSEVISYLALNGFRVAVKTRVPD